MSKIAKTIKISLRHEEWLNSQNINFSEWVRKKLDEEIGRQQRPVDRGSIKAVILAAGRDKNLFPLTEDIPKTLLDIKGKSILERQVAMLHTVGVDDIAVVRGYRKNRINLPDLVYFDNDEYQSTGSLASLFCAREFMDRDTLVMYGDILFDVVILKTLIESHSETTLVVDRGWKKYYRDTQEKRPKEPELAMLTDKGEGIEIHSAGVGLPIEDSTTEFIGLARFSIKACTILRDIYENVYKKDPGVPFHHAKQIRSASVIDFIKELLDRQEKVNGLEIWRSWIDIDTFEDYRNAWKLVDETLKGEL
jgi:phosphoenolpyruvate phosphomutase